MSKKVTTKKQKATAAKPVAKAAKPQELVENYLVVLKTGQKLPFTSTKAVNEFIKTDEREYTVKNAQGIAIVRKIFKG